jgi:hypothetical protein
MEARRRPRLEGLGSRSAYKPPSSNHLQRSLHAANGATAARVVDSTSSGNEVSVELSLTQRSDPRLFHWGALVGTHRLWESRTFGSHATLALDTVLNPCVFPDGFVGTFTPLVLDRDHGRSNVSSASRAFELLRHRSIFLVPAAHHDLEPIIRQRPLQRLRLIPWRARPDISFLVSGQDNRHGR